MTQPVLTVVTLGVRDLARSQTFYAALGFERRLRAVGEGSVAFFAAGGVVLGLFGWDALAEDAKVPAAGTGFRGVTLAWNRASPAEVEAGMAQALAAGATLVKHAAPTFYGGYSGYVADPDGHLWEIVQAPGFDLAEDGTLNLPE